MSLEMNIIKKLPGFELQVDFKANNNILGLLGASGSGKSMTLRCIAGIETPDKGKIRLNGRVLFDSEKGVNLPIRERKVGFLFQSYALFPNMTVEENIGFGLGKGISKAEKLYKIAERISAMHLNGLETRYPHQLSGGQQQRVALARALIVDPEILLLDEPFSALDEYLKNKMMVQLKEDLQDFGKTSIFVTHNMEEAYQLCNDIMIITEGKMDAFGYKEIIFNHPPTLSSAKITGCKNISRARKTSSNIIEAIDWKCNITLNHEVADTITDIGIRANHLKLNEAYECANTFSCWLVSTVETMFRVKVYLKLSEPINEEDEKYHLICDISKDQWNQLKDKPLPWKITMNPDRIILIKDKKHCKILY